MHVLHHCKYNAICSIDALVDDFDRFDLFLFFFEIDNLSSPKFCFLTSSQKLGICYFIPVATQFYFYI